MTPKKRIIIIDDHPLFREGMKTIIQASPKYDVVGEAGTAQKGIQLIRELKPDLAVVDISLPDQNGLDLIRHILNHNCDMKIMVVSMHSKIDYIVKAFQNGAKGYLTKESAAKMLLQGIEQIFKGEYFMDSAISPQVARKLAEMPWEKPSAIVDGYDTLTPREQEIMVMVANGMSSPEIAEQLFISPKTVENHRSRIMNKLGACNVIDLVRHAARLGLIDLDLWKE